MNHLQTCLALFVFELSAILCPVLRAAEDYPSPNVPPDSAAYINASRDALKKITELFGESPADTSSRVSGLCDEIQGRLEDLGEKPKGRGPQAMIYNNWLSAETATWARIAALAPAMGDTVVRINRALITTEQEIRNGELRIKSVEKQLAVADVLMDKFRGAGANLANSIDDINDDAELLVKGLAVAVTMQESANLLEDITSQIKEVEDALLTGFEESGSNYLAAVKLAMTLAKNVNDDATAAHEVAGKEYEALLQARAAVCNASQNPDLDRKGHFHEAWQSWVAVLDKHGEAYRKQADRMEREFTTTKDKLKKTLAFGADKVISFTTHGVFKLEDVPIGPDGKNRLERTASNLRTFFNRVVKTGYELYDKVSKSQYAQMRQFVREHHKKITAIQSDWIRDSARLNERSKTRMEAIHVRQKAVDAQIKEAKIDRTGDWTDAATIEQANARLRLLAKEDDQLSREEKAEREKLEQMEEQLVSVFRKKIEDAERDFRVAKAIEITKAIEIGEKDSGEKATMAKSLRAEVKALSDAMDKLELQLGSYEIQF